MAIKRNLNSPLAASKFDSNGPVKPIATAAKKALRKSILKKIDELNTKGLKMLDAQEQGVKGATEKKAHKFFDKALELEKKLK
jgi:hypothetical protein